MVPCVPSAAKGGMYATLVDEAEEEVEVAVGQVAARLAAEVARSLSQ